MALSIDLTTSHQPPPGAGFSENTLQTIQDSLADGKADNVALFDVRGKTSLTDYIIIATGNSKRHLTALTKRLEDVFSSQNVTTTVEGKGQSDWIVYDAGDVIIHLFTPEMRSYYGLDKIWGEGLF